MTTTTTTRRWAQAPRGGEAPRDEAALARCRCSEVAAGAARGAAAAPHGERRKKRRILLVVAALDEAMVQGAAVRLKSPHQRDVDLPPPCASASASDSAFALPSQWQRSSLSAAASKEEGRRRRLPHRQPTASAS